MRFDFVAREDVLSRHQIHDPTSLPVGEPVQSERLRAIHRREGRRPEGELACFLDVVTLHSVSISQRHSITPSAAHPASREARPRAGIVSHIVIARDWRIPTGV